MSHCWWCRHYRGEHAAGCPSTFPENSPERSAFRAGRADGRSGKTKARPEDPFYALGFHEGTIALEEAQNGFDPRFA